MLLSRFWYLFLATAVAAAVAAALLAQSAVNSHAEEAVTEALRHDVAMVDAMLRLEARSRLDRIAFITVDAKFGALLKQATGVTDAHRLEDLHAAVKGLMEMHVARMTEAASGASSAGPSAHELEPDIAFALDGDGRIIAQLGPLEPNPPGGSLATFPLVRRALQGYVRDDVWLYDRHVYRMAARPVLSGSEYAGAIVHGYRLEKGLLDKVSRSLAGASLTFFYDRELLGSRVPSDIAGAPQASELAAALPALAHDARYQAGERSQTLALGSGGMVVFDRINGSAAAQDVGYGVARPLHPLTSPLQLLQLASQDDVRALPLAWLIGGGLLLGAIGMLCLYLERDRHLRQLMRKTGELGSGERDRLIVTEWSGGYRALADRINQALEKAIEKAGERAPVARKKANLDEILGHTPASSVTPFFSFASEQPAGVATTAKAVQPAAAAPAAPAAAAPAAPAGTSAVAAALATNGGAASALAPAAGAPPVPKPAPPAGAKPPPPRPMQTLSGVSAAQPASQVVPMATFSLPPPSPSPPPAAPAGTAARGAAKLETEGNGDDAHWREVFEAYIATRKQCGEPTDNLNFEKFGVTLRKTRDQIIDKQGVKTVRFSVQVKEGKAALKAQPIKR